MAMFLHVSHHLLLDLLGRLICYQPAGYLGHRLGWQYCLRTFAGVPAKDTVHFQGWAGGSSLKGGVTLLAPQLGDSCGADVIGVRSMRDPFKLGALFVV